MDTVSAKDLAVTEVVVTPVAFPDPPLLNSVGVHQPWAIRTIVEVRTDSGLVGLGESYANDEFLASVRRAAPALVGLSPFDINGLESAVRTTLGLSSGQGLARVVSPFEVAFWDLQGQATGLPVHALLGGKVRDEVPFSAYLFYKWAAHPGAEPDEWGEALDADGMVRQARMMVERYGFGSLKFKGGVFEPDVEIETARALAAAFPDLPLRVDPNGAWTVPTSIRVGRALEGTLEYLEDPTLGRAGMAEVAREVSMPLATNMCTVAFDQIPESVELGSVGVILSDHHYWGGLRASAVLAGICQTFGIGLSMHSNSHLGISLAAMTHLAAATPNLTYACDTHTPWNPQDVVAERWSITGGAVRVPDSPGLGIALDRDALARLHEQYVKAGITSRDDTGYMRQFQPDFTAHKTIW